MQKIVYIFTVYMLVNAFVFYFADHLIRGLNIGT
jgi:hypothetical protein